MGIGTTNGQKKFLGGARIMPMERLAVVAAIQTAKLGQNGTNGSSYTGYVFHGYNMSNNGSSRTGRYETNLHGNVNILLGGAMMSGVLIVVILICYCCHKNIRKHRPREYSQYWRAEPDVHSPEVFTMDAHAMGYERTVGTNPEEAASSLLCPGTPAPPPAYESLVFNPRSLPSPSGKKDEPSSPGYILPISIQQDNENSTKKNDLPIKDDEDLPSYEAALNLESNGYV